MSNVIEIRKGTKAPQRYILSADRHSWILTPLIIVKEGKNKGKEVPATGRACYHTTVKGLVEAWLEESVRVSYRDEELLPFEILGAIKDIWAEIHDVFTAKVEIKE